LRAQPAGGTSHQGHLILEINGEIAIHGVAHHQLSGISFNK
jgi:hypothetical protein